MAKLLEYKPLKKMPDELGIVTLLSVVTVGGYLLFKHYHDSAVPNASQIDDKDRSSGAPVDESKLFNTEIIKAKYFAFTIVVAYIMEESDYYNIVRPTSQEITRLMYKYEKELEDVNKIRFISGNTQKGEKAGKMLAQKILREINEERKLRSMLI